MRLWHLIFAVAGLSLMLTLARDPLTRVFVIVFVSGLIETILATAAIMTLFQTLGALGEAKGFSAYLSAIAASSLIFAAAGALMSGWIFFAIWVVSISV